MHHCGNLTAWVYSRCGYTLVQQSNNRGLQQAWLCIFVKSNNRGLQEAWLSSVCTGIYQLHIAIREVLHQHRNLQLRLAVGRQYNRQGEVSVQHTTEYQHRDSFKTSLSHVGFFRQSNVQYMEFFGQWPRTTASLAFVMFVAEQLSMRNIIVLRNAIG